MDISDLSKGAGKLNKATKVVETVRDFEKNAKTARGTVKNAWNVSTLLPADPLTKIVVFIAMILIPLAILTIAIAAFIVILMGVAIIIITKDPSLKYGDGNKSSGSDGGGVADMSVPDEVKGKFLIPWGLSNITTCYHCRYDSYGYHRGMDLQYTAKDWSEGYDAMVYPIYPGKVVKAGDVGHWSWGHAVIVKHTLESGKTYYTLYAHMMFLKVKVGDEVGFNTPLGKIGNSGATSGSGKSWCKTGCGVHLHLELLNGAGYAKTGTSAQNLLPLYKYITCSDKGKTLINANGSASASVCTSYRKQKLEKYPW